jgi:hypothetical protein
VKIINRITIVFSVEIIILCLIASLRFVNIQSTIALIIFNLFFASLFFQLNGSTTIKVGMLTTGNIIGVFWNLFFYYLSLTCCEYFGLSFNAVFTLIYPILNLMWIVPFWSLSLSFLPKMQFPKTT